VEIIKNIWRIFNNPDIMTVVGLCIMAYCILGFYGILFTFGFCLFLYGANKF
jgi:hypothetical protein